MKVTEKQSISGYVGRRTATLLKELREECRNISNLLAQLESPLDDGKAEDLLGESRGGSSYLNQNVAIGFIGDPVPPLIGNGAAVSKNSHRFRAAAASLRASRSQLSIKWMPSDTSAKSWTAPGTSEGETYCG